MVRMYGLPLTVGCVLVFGSGCLTPQTDAVTDLIADTAAATVINASGGDIYLAIETAWEQTPTDFVRHGICQVNTGDAVRTQTCTLRVPEGRLFFSKAKLVFGTANTTTCHRVQFFPAMWQMSNAAVANTTTGYTGDCSGSSMVSIPGIPAIATGDMACFHGPTFALYTAYPAPIGKYFNTVAGALNESSETIDSGNELASGGTFQVLIDGGTYLSNFAVANKIDDTTASKVSPGGAEAYLANTMVPYRARCVDQYEQVQAEVIVNIADSDLETGEDPADPNNDQFWDFDQTL